MIQESHYWAYTQRKGAQSLKDLPAPPCLQGLFIIPKTWKPPTCLSMGEWIKKMCLCVCVSIYSPGHGTMQVQSIPGGCPEAWETPGGRHIWNHKSQT